MYNSETQTTLSRISFHARELADHSNVAYWITDDNSKEWHKDQCKEALATLIELHKSL
jgi:hypothetical protein